jgi:hypothetical protein
MACWNIAAPGLAQSKALGDLTTLMAFKRLKTFFGCGFAEFAVPETELRLLAKERAAGQSSRMNQSM